MRVKKFAVGLAVAVMALSFTACGSKPVKEVEGALSIDKENKEVSMICEVNGKFFEKSTRHAIVYQGGGNDGKAMLRGLADEKEFCQAMRDIGAEGPSNLTLEDVGKAVEGDKLELFIKWDGQDEIPFADIIVCSEGDYKMDMRFADNMENAKNFNSGCVVCLDSCCAGIVSDATWPTGSVDNDGVEFYADENVLPEDGTEVTVIFRLVK